MASHLSQLVPVPDPSAPGSVRRAARVLAMQIGLSDTDAGRVAIVATEAATNLARHAGGGQVLLRALDAPGVEVLALDEGPGIADVARAMQDGYSTAGGAGTGLGAIRRVADEFELWTQPGAGTALLARVRAAGVPAASGPMRVGAVCVPAPGETVSGDAWALEEGPDGRVRLLVVDGLGHGPPAAAAAEQALQAAALRAGEGPAALLQGLHLALRPTRGAAAAAAEISGGTLRYAGVGNIAASVAGPTGSRGLVSMNGTLGHGEARVKEFAQPWHAGSLLVMASDGLATHWALADYAGLAARDPALVAGVLWRDHSRGRDDATVVVLRERKEGP